MAQKLKANDEDGRATKNHNVKEIKQAVRDAARAIISLKEERAEINAQITEARAKVKAFGIKMTDFNVALRYYELEVEDRNEAVDMLRVCFEALEIGGQGDLFPEPAASESAPAMH